jgi:hypothetical protein
LEESETASNSSSIKNVSFSPVVQVNDSGNMSYCELNDTKLESEEDYKSKNQLTKNSNGC